MAAPIRAILRDNEEEEIAVKAEITSDVDTIDEYDNIERMYTEILSGTPKSASRTIRTKEDADDWDTLTAQVADIIARGHIPIYGYPTSEE